MGFLDFNSEIIEKEEGRGGEREKWEEKEKEESEREDAEEELVTVIL